MKTTEVIHDFIAATEFVFLTMTQITLTPGRPYLKTDPASTGVITGLVPLYKEQHTGSISLSMTKEGAMCALNAMFGDDIVNAAEDAKEMVGELVNILSGDVRRRFAEKNLVYSGGTPHLFVGQGHCIEHTTSAPIVAIPFALPEGFCVVEFGLDAIE